MELLQNQNLTAYDVTAPGYVNFWVGKHRGHSGQLSGTIHYANTRRGLLQISIHGNMGECLSLVVTDDLDISDLRNFTAEDFIPWY